MILVRNGLSAYWSRTLRARIAQQDRLALERLPAYSPEPNPAELLWPSLKRRKIANLTEQDVHRMHNPQPRNHNCHGPPPPTPDSPSTHQPHRTHEKISRTFTEQHRESVAKLQRASRVQPLHAGRSGIDVTTTPPPHRRPRRNSQDGPPSSNAAPSLITKTALNAILLGPTPQTRHRLHTPRRTASRTHSTAMRVAQGWQALDMNRCSHSERTGR
nr:transposase [Streptomyces sp. 3211]